MHTDVPHTGPRMGAATGWHHNASERSSHDENNQTRGGRRHGGTPPGERLSRVHPRARSGHHRGTRIIRALFVHGVAATHRRAPRGRTCLRRVAHRPRVGSHRGALHPVIRGHHRRADSGPPHQLAGAVRLVGRLLGRRPREGRTIRAAQQPLLRRRHGAREIRPPRQSHTRSDRRRQPRARHPGADSRVGHELR
jgi:hypothetical protein